MPVRERYEFFREQIKRAQAHGLRTQGDLEAYCSTAIEFGATFDEQREVRAALAGIKKGQTFDQSLTTLTSNDWRRVRSERSERSEP